MRIGGVSEVNRVFFVLPLPALVVRLVARLQNILFSPNHSSSRTSPNRSGSTSGSFPAPRARCFFPKWWDRARRCSTTITTAIWTFIWSRGIPRLLKASLWCPFRRAGNRATACSGIISTETGKLTFTDVTESAGVGYADKGMGVAAGDYDNDGYVDLYVTNYGHNILYHNNGNGTFTDVTASAGVASSGWSTSAAFIDYDRDGLLDIAVVHYVDFYRRPCYMFEGRLDYCGPSPFKGTATELVSQPRERAVQECDR